MQHSATQPARRVTCAIGGAHDEARRSCWPTWPVCMHAQSCSRLRQTSSSGCLAPCHAEPSAAGMQRQRRLLPGSAVTPVYPCQASGLNVKAHTCRLRRQASRCTEPTTVQRHAGTALVAGDTLSAAPPTSVDTPLHRKPASAPPAGGQLTPLGSAACAERSLPPRPLRPCSRTGPCTLESRLWRCWRCWRPPQAAKVGAGASERGRPRPLGRLRLVRRPAWCPSVCSGAGRPGGAATGRRRRRLRAAAPPHARGPARAGHALAATCTDRGCALVPVQHSWLPTLLPITPLACTQA